MHLFLEMPVGKPKRTKLHAGDEITIHKPEALEPYMTLLRRRKRSHSSNIRWSTGDDKLVVGNTTRASVLARVISEVTGFDLEQTAQTPIRCTYVLKRRLREQAKRKKSRKR